MLALKLFQASLLTWFRPSTFPTPVCSTVSFQIAATAQNAVFASPPKPNNETEILNFVHSSFGDGAAPVVNGTTPVSGTFTINAVYCRPHPENDKDSLEILVHGLSYNKSYWSGLGMGDFYDWQAYANSKGYSTLAIDRLGYGSNPQRPDPLNIVQGRLEIEILHQLIEALRTNHRNPLKRRFDSIVYVGHSFGSILGAGLVRAYPSDVKALVLTGWSTTITYTDFLDAAFESASIFDRRRFPNLQLGYVTVSNESQHTSLFYAGAFDHRVAEHDFAIEDTWAIGESGYLGFIEPPVNYTGSVYLATGVQDVLFCQPPIETCEMILNVTHAEFFPGVTAFGYTAVENTGHVLSLHYSAQRTFANVHMFLDSVLT